MYRMLTASRATLRNASRTWLAAGAAATTAGAAAAATVAAFALDESAIAPVAHARSRLPPSPYSRYGDAEPKRAADMSGAEFKDQLKAGIPKFGLFCNSASPTVAEHISNLGYDWILVDTQHGPMNSVLLSSMLLAIAKGGCKSMVRVSAYDDRGGIQQALDLGADGILVPYVNNAEEVEYAVSCAKYPTKGTRSVYFPQRSMFEKGLLGYAGASNDNVIVAMQIETADSIKNIDTISAVDGVDMLFLGRNDLCMSMGLFEKYEFPHMYTSPELEAAQIKLIAHAKRNNKLLGLFLFGTKGVDTFLDKGFSFISVGNDLHHILTSAKGHVETLEGITAGAWKHKPSNMI